MTGSILTPEEVVSDLQSDKQQHRAMLFVFLFVCFFQRMFC